MMMLLISSAFHFGTSAENLVVKRLERLSIFTLFVGLSSIVLN